MNAKPPIWRRILVSDQIKLGELHSVIQIAMGWTNSHLHQFVIGNSMYGKLDPEMDWDNGMLDESNVTLNTFLKKEKDSLTYDYDFGDGWEHKVVLEKIGSSNDSQVLPFCVTGRRACPPEDVGGVWGYEGFLEAYTDKKHPEHLARVDWVGEDFNLEEFSANEVNLMLKIFQ